VKLLIDTHTLLWAYWADPQLSAAAARFITDPANTVFVSPASHWEVAIKMSTGKLTPRESFPDFVQHAIFDNGFVILPVEPRHTAVVATLPFHHRDPFDRLLVAQAVAEQWPVVSADAAFDPYPVTRLW
jgi:PIN domain nuclease of toxin-antitoxin system